MGKGYNIFKIDEKNNLFEILKDETFKFTINHNIPYEEYRYNINKSIKKDFYELNKIQ